jgi:hypothetical protein
LVFSSSAGKVLLMAKHYSCFQVGPEFFLMFDEPEKVHHVPQKTELQILSLVMTPPVGNVVLRSETSVHILCECEALVSLRHA